MKELVQIHSYCPLENLAAIRNGLNELGLLGFGSYDYVFNYAITRGSWRPLEGSSPYLGAHNQIEEAEEARFEFVCPRARAAEAVAKIRALHPYEEPVINVLPLLNGEF